MHSYGLAKFAVPLIITQRTVNFVAIDLEINSQYKVLQKMSADGAHYFYSPAMKHSIPSCRPIEPTVA